MYLPGLPLSLFINACMLFFMAAKHAHRLQIAKKMGKFICKYIGCNTARPCRVKGGAMILLLSEYKLVQNEFRRNLK